MLFDFHRQQNAKKPGTIHATYLIIGTRQVEEKSKVSNGADIGITEDGYMQSSPFTCSPLSSSDESVEIPVQTITLVREADLEKVRSKYEHIDSIHIYSLGLYSVKDLQVLSEATQRLDQLCSGEDPLKSCSTYGTIQNKYLKTRVQRRPSLVVPSSSVKTASSTVGTVSKNKNPAVESKIGPISAQLSTKTTSIGVCKSSTTSVLNPPENSSIKQSTSKTVTNSKIQKHDKSSILTAFARTESIQKHEKKPEKKKNYISEKTVASASEDILMKDVFSDNNENDDDDNDDDDDDKNWAPLTSEIKNNNTNRKSKREREEELRKMMEDDYEEENKEKEIITSLICGETDATTSKEVAVAINEQTSIDAGKKRRSRRRVMKKTTYKDEEGYLVTKEEPAWESFSEDEPSVPIPKPMVKNQNQQSTTSKPKKGTVGKSMQGNIMSFFGKKS
ncbi:hypothetical protein OnM2_029028 [Erysiphe neolycopersici]|uniref:DNA polymerase delta subunit 3 n=1 Tax=Erysiphe neolycopersici TaxID=212602 RepID=A0A420HZR2_9PEZI|nr:hypothetical protein OnM2_029028 [Erysiphe neolycopersici]